MPRFTGARHIRSAAAVVIWSWDYPYPISSPNKGARFLAASPRLRIAVAALGRKTSMARCLTGSFREEKYPAHRSWPSRQALISADNPLLSWRIIGNAIRSREILEAQAALGEKLIQA